MIAILIPTLGRAEMLPALVANIHAATTTAHRIYLVIESDDRATLDASKELDTVDVIGKFGSCSIAMNAGYKASTEPFVFIANDDCVFHKGWDTAALAHMGGQVQIVGVNDGNGDCLCFSLVRRSFIEEHSGVFDKPDTLFHTYLSQGPDTEFAFYAMLRGVWDAAPEALVQHCRIEADLHLKARSTITSDLEEYLRRWKQWDPEQRCPPPAPTVSPL
jgi:glycosyltransferase involved in cell wall biosynthesis